MKKIVLGKTKVIPKSNGNGHNYQIGKTYVIIQNYGNGTFACRDPETGWIGNCLSQMDCNVLFEKINKNDLIKDIKKIKDILDEKEMYVKFLEEENLEECNDSEFLSWYLIKLFESNDRDKRSKISRIINSISNNINIHDLNI